VLLIVQFSMLCFVLFVFVLCLVYPMLLLSLNCLFLIAPSVFSNVYCVPDVATVSELSILDFMEQYFQ
jgi:hypothetical protein